ncbi:MAG TPA: LuxR C-terminal-related transcriptional regulator [Gaiellaceae bacterium]|nr:LuxR C-terminal-related transcriptional regulator [Gaiellaceae bacterium]
MPALTNGDAERLLRFVAEAQSLNSDEPFTPELLVELGRVIEADLVVYHEDDYARRRQLLYVLRPGDDDEDEDEDITEDEWDLMNEHPICRLWTKGGRFRALRLSDVITRREFHQSRIYAEFFAPSGMEYELKVRLPSPLWHGKTFAFYRKEGRDFAVRDRLALQLLTPHFSRLWHEARTRRLLAKALEELDRANEHSSRGVIFLGPDGEAEFISPPVHRLLRDFFPAAPADRLPAALADWLEDARSQSLLRRRGDRRLVIERTADSVILEERAEEIPLTARERDVLSWVARGKTNAEIAQLLWLAPSTVRKHLENVYAKLGVNTRTAAVARFLGLLDAEAS